MEKIKFVHCADIHLGANPFEIEERFEDMGKAFKQVCEFAINEKVNFVLIAGDFFHNKVLNPKTLEQAVNILEKVKQADIPVFLTEGNHDMETYSNVYSWLQFLSSRGYIYLLRGNKRKDENVLKIWDGKEGSIYDIGYAYIIGLGYPGSTAKKYIEKVNSELEELIKNEVLDDKPIICMLHTGIDRFVTEAMGGLRENEIEGLLEKIDYLALGHIHKRYENPEKKYFNPGSVECVRINDNPFNRGFYYATIDLKTKKVETEFKRVNIRNSIILDFNAEGIESYEELEEEIIKNVQDEYKEKCIPDSKIMLQIKIVGDVLKGKFKVDIVKLKGKIASLIPVLHQEIIDLIRYVDVNDVIVSSNLSRDEIDKLVLENKIKKQGFKCEEVQAVYNIIDKMKEYGQSDMIDLESTYGEEIEKMLIQLVETENE